MIDKNLIIATDLDGTFLGGSRHVREAFYNWIEAHRDAIGLIFVTGRDPEFIESLCHDGQVPWPEYVVGDVGTSIAEVATLADPTSGDRRPGKRAIRPIPELESEISIAWNDAGDRVRAMLAGAAGLRLQETPFRYRVSYDLDPANFDMATQDLVRAAGFDVLISDNRFFDVLPPGVSKGPSLRRLLRYLGLADHNVLVAGDTLNDLSLFETGLKGVAVANSEPALVERVSHRSTVYRSKSEGAGGIAEAIRHFRFFVEPGVVA